MKEIVETNNEIIIGVIVQLYNAFDRLCTFLAISAVTFLWELRKLTVGSKAAVQ